jgi:hypothetical protein
MRTPLLQIAGSIRDKVSERERGKRLEGLTLSGCRIVDAGCGRRSTKTRIRAWLESGEPIAVSVVAVARDSFASGGWAKCLSQRHWLKHSGQQASPWY